MEDLCIPVIFVDIVAIVQEIVVEESVRYKDLTSNIVQISSGGSEGLLLTDLTDGDGDVEELTEEEAGGVLVKLVVNVFTVVLQQRPLLL